MIYTKSGETSYGKIKGYHIYDFFKLSDGQPIVCISEKPITKYTPTAATSDPFIAEIVDNDIDFTNCFFYYTENNKVEIVNNHTIRCTVVSNPKNSAWSRLFGFVEFESNKTPLINFKNPKYMLLTNNSSNYHIYSQYPTSEVALIDGFRNYYDVKNNYYVSSPNGLNAFTDDRFCVIKSYIKLVDFDLHNSIFTNYIGMDNSSIRIYPMLRMNASGYIEIIECFSRADSVDDKVNTYRSLICYVYSMNKKENA